MPADIRILIKEKLFLGLLDVICIALLMSRVQRFYCNKSEGAVCFPAVRIQSRLALACESMNSIIIMVFPKIRYTGEKRDSSVFETSYISLVASGGSQC